MEIPKIKLTLTTSHTTTFCCLRCCLCNVFFHLQKRWLYTYGTKAPSSAPGAPDKAQGAPHLPAAVTEAGGGELPTSARGNATAAAAVRGSPLGNGHPPLRGAGPAPHRHLGAGGRCRPLPPTGGLPPRARGALGPLSAAQRRGRPCPEGSRGGRGRQLRGPPPRRRLLRRARPRAPVCVCVCAPVCVCAGGPAGPRLAALARRGGGCGATAASRQARSCPSIGAAISTGTR